MSCICLWSTRLTIGYGPSTGATSGFQGPSMRTNVTEAPQLALTWNLLCSYCLQTNIDAMKEARIGNNAISVPELLFSGGERETHLPLHIHQWRRRAAPTRRITSPTPPHGYQPDCWPPEYSRGKPTGRIGLHKKSKGHCICPLFGKQGRVVSKEYFGY